MNDELETERIRAAIRASWKVIDADGTGLDQPHDIERSVVRVKHLIQQERKKAAREALGKLRSRVAFEGARSISVAKIDEALKELE